MALRGTLLCICSLAALSCSEAQDETSPGNCSSTTRLLEQLSADLRVAVECGEDLPPAWSEQQSAALLLHMRNLTGSLHRHQLSGCRGAEPKECPEPEVPRNGGLVCLTVDHKRYCKPLCNHGYDFTFIRRSRLFDVCSEQTRCKWDSQHVGGNTLAVCSEASVAVAGARSAYFLKGQDCLKTRSSGPLQSRLVEEFGAELKEGGVQGEPRASCLVCGST